jgi:hypothetical protein
MAAFEARRRRAFHIKLLVNTELARTPARDVAMAASRPSSRQRRRARRRMPLARRPRPHRDPRAERLMREGGRGWPHGGPWRRRPLTTDSPRRRDRAPERGLRCDRLFGLQEVVRRPVLGGKSNSSWRVFRSRVSLARPTRIPGAKRLIHSRGWGAGGSGLSPRA